MHLFLDSKGFLKINKKFDGPDKIVVVRKHNVKGTFTQG
jgi:hypothetical protein